MKKEKLIIRLLCFLFALLITVTAYIITEFKHTSETSGRIHNIDTVIVDAGHGGEDGGAVALDGSAEKDYNLNIAVKLRDILSLYGFNVIMTRTEDIMTCDDKLETLRQRKVSDIHNRFMITEKYPDSIFVSIHQNKFSDTAQKGTQVFYSGNNFKSKILADKIQETITQNLQPDNRRITKKSGTEIYILYHSKIPSVLVECGFISNKNDLNNLKDDSYRTQLAVLIAEGILKYKG